MSAICSSSESSRLPSDSIRIFHVAILALMSLSIGVTSIEIPVETLPVESTVWIRSVCFAFIHDLETIRLLPGHYTYDDDGDGINRINDTGIDDFFERKPHIAHFQAVDSHFDFVLVNNHIKPDSAEKEIPLLIKVAEDAEVRLDEPDIIILGDLNADGSYFDEDVYLRFFLRKNIAGLFRTL